MTISTTTHLNFAGDARAALEFYQSVFGGQLAAISYADAHAPVDPSRADHLTWGQVVSDEGFRVMAYDVQEGKEYAPGLIPVFVSVRGADAEEITRYWEKLVDGSTVIEPLAPSQWAPLYGMLRDRFGVTWVLDVEVAWG